MQATNRAPSDPRWDDLFLFLTLFREGSLARAATRLGVDASTVSRRVAALETQLGVTLFDRTPDGLRATLHAEQLVIDAEAMEASAERLLRGAESFERSVEGTVKLSAPPGLVDAFVVPILPALQKAHPNIVLELDARVGVVDLTRREADIALRTLPPRGAELIQKRLIQTHSVVAGTPALVRSLGMLKSWADVPFIQWGEDLAHLPQSRWVREKAKGCRVVLISSNFATQIAAARLGLGLLVVPRPYLDVYGLEEPKMSRLLRETTANIAQDELFLVSHRVLRQVPRVDAVWRFLDAHFTSGTRPTRAKVKD